MAYIEKPVSIQELYDSKKTGEPSIRALRSRAQEGILVYVRSQGNEHLYDETLSVIRARAARECKRPGVRWKDIKRELPYISITNDKIKELLNSGVSEEKIIQMLRDELNSRLT